MRTITGRLRTVVLDAADMDAEAQFWSALLDIPVVHRSDDWSTLQGRGVRLAVQLAPDHVPPDWPDPARPQQLHLDIEVDDVDDVDEAERHVLALGALRLTDPPDAEDFRVYADPAGHPFCLVFNT
jgi:catechol 2,3-dioxygenase-like lactoylglutathione lyase family enzyme